MRKVCTKVLRSYLHHARPETAAAEARAVTAWQASGGLYTTSARLLRPEGGQGAEALGGSPARGVSCRAYICLSIGWWLSIVSFRVVEAESVDPTRWVAAIHHPLTARAGLRHARALLSTLGCRVAREER